MYFGEATLEHFSDARQTDRSSPERYLETCLDVSDLPRSRDFYASLCYPATQPDDRFCAFSVDGRQALLLFVRGSDPQGTSLPFGTNPPHGTSDPARVGFRIPQRVCRPGRRVAEREIPLRAPSPGRRVVRPSIFATPMDISLSLSLQGFGRSPSTLRELASNAHLRKRSRSIDEVSLFDWTRKFELGINRKIARLMALSHYL